MRRKSAILGVATGWFALLLIVSPPLIAQIFHFDGSGEDLRNLDRRVPELPRFEPSPPQLRAIENLRGQMQSLAVTFDQIGRAHV